MTSATSLMKWCSAYCSLTVWVTSLFIDEVLDYIQVATKTSNVDWHVTISLVMLDHNLVLRLDTGLVPYDLQALMEWCYTPLSSLKEFGSQFVH